MKNMKKILVAMLCILMTINVMACGNAGNTNDTNQETDAGSENDNTEKETGEQMTYTVKVIDESGNPVSGIVVQWYANQYEHGVTGADGLATYLAAEADYEVSVSVSEDDEKYQTDETKYHYQEDAKELIIVLKSK